MFTSRKNKFVKKAEQFKESEEDKIKYKSFVEMGNNLQKSIFKKIPVSAKDLADPGKSKFQNPWLLKPASKNETISSEGFRILLGEQFAPKYRIYVHDDGKRSAVTKLLAGFTPWVIAVKSVPDVDDAEAKTLNYRGDPTTDYGKRMLKYLKTVAALENYHKMIAVCLLFGKDDLHGGNWGVVDLDGKRFAGTVDHEHALSTGFNMYDILYHNELRKEVFLSVKFVSSCRQVIAEFGSKKELLSQKMSECISDLISGGMEVYSIGYIDYIMSVLEKNKAKLIEMCFQIEAEMAIKNGDTVALRAALLNLPEDYFPENDKDGIKREIISMQNYRDGFISSSSMSLRSFIQRRNFDDCDIYSPSRAKLTSADIELENELLAVYDEVALTKRSAHTTQFRLK